MIFCIEIKPFLLVKLGEVSESMKSDTNPNFMHFQGNFPQNLHILYLHCLTYLRDLMIPCPKLSTQVLRKVLDTSIGKAFIVDLILINN